MSGQPSCLDGAPQPASRDDTYFSAATAILAAAPVRLDDRLLAEVLARQYGMRGEVELLSSEAESTAAVLLPDSRRLILKASRQPEAMDSFRFQSAAIHAVESHDGFVSPQVLSTSDRELMFEQDGLWGYLQTRLPGIPLHQAPISGGLLYATGKALAYLDLALKDCVLPAADRPVLWHPRCWPRLLDLLQYLPPGLMADAVRRAMSDYLDTIDPRIGELDWQVTHNDPSPYNTFLVDESIAFIDFGDGCWGPRIQDLAIAASHMVIDPAFPLGGAESMIAGYASALPLSQLEADLLVGLMMARQSALILINHWRSQLFPEQASYIKKNVARAERGLSILIRLGSADGRATVAKAAASS